MSYARFAAMIATSTIVMFGLMYLNSYSLDHVFYSQTRTCMAVVMGASMAVIMLLFMWSMHEKSALMPEYSLAAQSHFQSRSGSSGARKPLTTSTICGR